MSRFPAGSAAAAGAGVFVPATWNPSDKDASITLSNGDLTAVSVAGTGRHAVRSTTGLTSGKHYCEITYTSGTNTILGLGIVGGSVSLSSGNEVCDPGCSMDMTGRGYVNSVVDFDAPTVAAGSVVQLAIDLDNQDMWVGDDGAWLGSGSPDPATLTDPTYSGFDAATEYFIRMVCRAGNVTANFGASAFAHSVPTGFTAGWGE